MTNRQKIHPLSAGREVVWMAVIALIIIVIQITYVRLLGHKDYQEEIFDWQVSAFNSFEGADQAIYNALYTVKDEIPYIYDDINRFNEPGVKFRWPNLADFQEYYLSPFYQDSSWIQNGSLQWSLYEPLPEGEMQGYSMYLGTNGSQPTQGSFLLTIGHVHAGFQNNNALDIWWHPDNQIIMPASGFKDSLIREGWKYVVAYSGDKEIKRLFGE
jgi:hypothetical protein